MDGSDLPTTSGPSAGDQPRETTGAGGAEHKDTAPLPDRCEALAAAIAGVLGGALEEHEERAAATVRSQGELAAAIDRLNGGTLSPTSPRLLVHLGLKFACSLLLLLLLFCGGVGSSSPRVFDALCG
jgi:hypothetical protein